MGVFICFSKDVADCLISFAISETVFSDCMAVVIAVISGTLFPFLFI